MKKLTKQQYEKYVAIYGAQKLEKEVQKGIFGKYEKDMELLIEFEDKYQVALIKGLDTGTNKLYATAGILSHLSSHHSVLVNAKALQTNEFWEGVAQIIVKKDESLPAFIYYTDFNDNSIYVMD